MKTPAPGTLGVYENGPVIVFATYETWPDAWVIPGLPAPERHQVVIIGFGLGAEDDTPTVTTFVTTIDVANFEPVALGLI